MYTLIVFLSAAGALTLEIAAGRMIAPYVGMSLYTWTAIIAVVLAGLSVGHWVGGRIADRETVATNGHRDMMLALGAAAVSTLLCLPLLRFSAGYLLMGNAESIQSVVLLTSALFFLPSLFAGIISPIATKLAIDTEPARTGAILGRMFAAGALGSILGTLASGYLFISWIGTNGTVLAVAALYVVLAVILIPKARATAAPLVVLLAALGGAGLWTHQADALTSPCDRETDYFCIRIDDFSAMSGRESRLMVLDHLVHSINDKADPTLLYSPYVHFVDEVVRRRFPGKGPASAYFVGGGGFTLPRAWLTAFPETEMVVAEIDPEVTAMAEEELWLDRRDDRLTVRDADARIVLRQLPAQQTFDVVFGDAFHDIAVPAHLVSDEFNALIKERLSPNGLYAINAVDRAREPRFIYSLVKTLKQRFESVEVWLESEVSLDDERVTFILLASDAPSPEPTLRSLFGIERRWLRWPDDDLTTRVAAIDPPVLTDQYAPVERLLFPGF